MIAPRFRRLRQALALLLALLAVPFAWSALKLARNGHPERWVPSYLADLARGGRPGSERTTDLIFLLCDHWEPGSGQAGIRKAARWLERYKPIADRYHDTQGRRFQYTWFYPIDNMEPAVLRLLARAASEGYGEIEVHWHHNHRSEEAFCADLQAGLAQFTAVGALVAEPGAEPRWCFIHGNWALDGSVPKRCGMNRELTLLQRYGCYADLTFPAPGTTAQPATINRIYYAQDDPRPRSYDKGVPATVGSHGEGLLMLPGPLGLDLRDPLILIEHGVLDDARGSGFSGRILHPASGADYFSAHRVALWDDIHVCVAGRPEWCFVKIHAHGVQHRKILLGGELAAMLDAVTAYCRQRGIRLHFVTAREACNLVWAAERGLTGDPTPYYDLVIPPPVNRRQVVAEPVSAHP